MESSSSSSSSSSSLKPPKLHRQPWQDDDDATEEPTTVKRFKSGNVFQKPASDAKEFEFQLKTLVTYLQDVGLLDLGLGFTQLAHPDLPRICVGYRARPDFCARTSGLIHVGSLSCLRDMCLYRISCLCEKQRIAQSRMPPSHFRMPITLLHYYHSQLLIQFWFDLKIVCMYLPRQHSQSLQRLYCELYGISPFIAERVDPCIFKLIETVNNDTFFDDPSPRRAAVLQQLEEKLLAGLQVVLEEGTRIHNLKRGSCLDGILIEPLAQLAWDYLAGDTFFGADQDMCENSDVLQKVTITGTAY
jgi:hypothetical protein